MKALSRVPLYGPATKFFPEVGARLESRMLGIIKVAFAVVVLVAAPGRRSGGGELSREVL